MLDDDNNLYIPTTPTINPPQKSLQLEILQFNAISVTPVPTSQGNGSGGTNGTPDGPGRCASSKTPYIPNSDPSFQKESAFIKLVTGQGRCIPWANAAAFVQFIKNNDRKGHNYFSRDQVQDSELIAIYNKATHSDSGREVNPVLVVATWGMESSFGSNGTEQFGCDHGPKPFTFDNQLDCLVNNVFDRWMNHFETQSNQNPYKASSSCWYEDAFVYAFERHNNICLIRVGDPYRTNFVNFYNDFIYGI
jgi:hypothetical protein